MPTPHFERGAAVAEREKAKEKEKRGDVFEPPYNPNLYVGELQDEEEGTEYVVLVSELVRYLRELYERTDLSPTLPAPNVSLQLNKYSVVEEHFLLVTKGTFFFWLAVCTHRDMAE